MLDIKTLDLGEHPKNKIQDKIKKIGSTQSTEIGNILQETPTHFHKQYLNVRQNSNSSNTDKDKFSDILDTIEDNLKENNIKKSLVSRVINIVSELGENIIKYSPGVDNYLTVDIKDNIIKITTSNLIEDNEQIKQRLKDNLNELNKLSEDELKERYMKIMQNKEFNKQGGGGLGLIGIARRAKKTNNNGVYNIKYLDIPENKKQEKKYQNKSFVQISVEIPIKSKIAA